MARMRLQQGAVINHKKWPPGTTFADSGGAALAGDQVWTGLNSTSWAPYMIDLDAGATTIKNASRFANVAPPRPDGVTSIEA